MNPQPLESRTNQLAHYGCPDISKLVVWPEEPGEPVVVGGFYNIYLGRLQGKDDLISIKVTLSEDWDDFVNEVRAIAPVQHPNVLRFLGFVNQDNENIGLVYPWMQNSNLNSYLALHPDADRCQLCVEIAEGVVYLHSMGIVHGDLRARNVLISDGGVAKITGFGSSVLQRDTPERHRFFQFAPRWAAPERMFEDERSWPSETRFASRTQLAEKFVDSTRPWVPSWPTTKSDVWSLALTVLEAMTDQRPFAGLSDLRVTYAVAEQMQTPSRPDTFKSIKSGYDNILWSLLQSCWAYDPTARPTASAVRDIMRVLQREGQQLVELPDNNDTGTLIEHTTPLSGVVERLVAHGCPDISRQIAAIDEGSKRSGRSSDVYWGKLYNGAYVVVKCLRTLSNSDAQPDKVLKHTAHELYTWSMSSHPNILELLGLTVFHDRLAMVSPWMTYGSLLSYIRAHPTVDCYGLCVQVAEGLAYMHEQGIAHGDVKGDNVVVSDTGVAKLTDFGCASMKRDFPVYFTVTDSLNYSVRWAAPELFLEDGLSSFETDVYAFAMTILEAITGEVPHKDRADRVIIHAVVVKRELPTRPTEYLPSNSKQADELWDMLERCWSYAPEDRPNIYELRDFLQTTAQRNLLA